MDIADAFMHIWGTESSGLPLNSDEIFTAEQAIQQMDEAGVARAVLVPTIVSAAVVGIRLGLDAVRDYPGRFCVMDRFDPERPATKELAHCKQKPGVLGIRLWINESIADGYASWIWPVAEEAGIPVMMFAPGQTDAIHGLAEQFPEMRIMLDHLNLPSKLSADQLAPCLEEIMALARHPNITVKFSSLFSRFSEPYPLPSLRPLVERVVGSFGADRCMFSSDGSVQVHGQPCSYRQWIDLFTDAADFLSESDLALLMGGAVSRWLDWPPLD